MEDLSNSLGNVFDYNGLGLKLFKAGRLEEASNAFKEELTLNPNHTSAQLNIAITYWGLKQRNKALEHIANALKTGSHKRNVVWHALLMLEKSGQDLAAIEVAIDYLQYYDDLEIRAKLEQITGKELASINIEITTYCNLRCKGCDLAILDSQGLWDSRHMDFEDYQKIIDELPPINMVKIWGIGEPVLHAKLPDMIQYANSTGKFGNIRICTNALARKIDYYFKLFDLGLSSIQISVDSLDPTIADNLRSGTNVEKLKTRLRDLAIKFKDRIRINTTVGKTNVGLIPCLLDDLVQLGIVYVNLAPYQDLGNPSECLTAEERVWFVDQLPEMRQQFPNLNISQAPFAPLTDLCRQPWTRAYVTVDGYVTPCCEISDPKRYNYGNTIQSKFAEVYNGLETNSWRQKFLVESPPACEGCTTFTLRKKIV